MSKVDTFANIKVAFKFRKVTFYSVAVEEESTLFNNFLKAHIHANHSDDISILRKYFTKLGNEIGADARYFREEGFRGGYARALPPPPAYLDFSDRTSIRLYAMLLNHRSVVLFGGAIKTAQTAQDCPAVRPHFIQANRLSKLIYEEIQNGTIQFTTIGEIDMTGTTSFKI